ncbi:MAG: O-antigen ligase family protein [Pseudomonadota bacterium]
MAFTFNAAAMPATTQQQAHWSVRLARWETLGVKMMLLLAVFLTTSSGYFLFVRVDYEAASSVNVTARDNPIYMLLWASFYLAALGSFAWSLLTRGLNRSFLLGAALIGLVIASATWSVNYKTTLFFGIMFCMKIIAGYTLSQLLHPRSFLRILAWYLIFALFWSYAMLIIAPEHVIGYRWGGRWTGVEFSGIFSHKSDAGYYWAALFLIMLNGPLLGFSRTFSVLGMVGVAATMPLTNSITGVVALLVLFAHFAFFARMHALHQQTLLIIGVSLLILSVAIPYLDVGSLLASSGSDISLTGRSDIWSSASEFVSTQPFFGYGYYGFFATNTFSPAWDLWSRAEYFRTPHFHNSPLDVMISLGIMGLLLYIAIVGMALSVLFNQSLPHGIRITLASLVVLFLISTVMDFTFFKHNAFASLFLFYCSFASQTNYDRGPRGPA